MSDARDFQEEMRQIGELVGEIEVAADPALRAATKNLMQLLMGLHGAVLEKTLDIVSEAAGGMNIIDRLAREPVVSSILILYGLHPDAIETRVERAIERVRPQLRKQGCELELQSVENGTIRLRVETGSHTCGSTAKGLRATVEGAIYDAAPDLISLTIEGFEEKMQSSFVALDKLMGSDAGHFLANTGQPPSGD